MKFKVGDILCAEGCSDRRVVKINKAGGFYSLSFIKDPSNHLYDWMFKDAHNTYKLKIPPYIPKEEDRMYIREKRKKRKHEK